MAALALQPARNLFSLSLRSPILPRALFASGWVIPSLHSFWRELFPSILRAVPKKKTSHSRKAMRQANKGLKDKQNIVSCQACGSPKMAHNLCPNCYSFLTRMWKKAKKQVMPDYS